MDNLMIRKRYDMLVDDRKSLDDTLQVIQQFVVPFRGEYFKPMTSEQEVEWRRREIYDSTAIDACQNLASSMQGSLTSPSVKWFTLGFRQEALRNDHESRIWLEACDEAIYQALTDSNFNVEASEFYIDLSAFGTGVITEEEADDFERNGIEFMASPLADTYFEEDSRGEIVNYYRRIKWTAVQIVSKFFPDLSGMPDWLKTEYEKDTNTKHEIIYCIFKRPENAGADTGTILSPDKRPYGSKYILHKDASQMGQTGGKYEMPSFVGRWKKVSGSRWGHSPAFVCLSDILTLNELTEQTLEALGKVVDPSTIVTQRGLLSDLDLGRGGLTVALSKDDIWAYESKARFDVGELRIDRLQESIRNAFFVNQLTLKESPAMTATEVQVRYELMQRLLGPTLGRLENDFLNPMITRTFNILARNRVLPPAPQLVVDMQAEYDVNYIGPLPRAQKSQTADSIMRYMALIGQVGEMFPEVKDIPDPDLIARDFAILTGVPARLNRTKTQVQQARKKREEIQKQQIANELAKGQGEAQQALNEANNVTIQ